MYVRAMKTLITENEGFIRLLLDNACAGNMENGVGIYHIETHCVSWWIEAYKDEDGWHVLSMQTD